MPVYFLILLPLIAAASFYLAVRLFNYLLYNPAEPVQVLGLKIQGIIPAQFPAISEGVAAEAGKLVAQSGIAAKAEDPEITKRLMPGIEAHIDGFLQERLKEKIPVLAMFLSDQVLLTIRKSLVEEIEALLPNVIGQFAGQLEKGLDVEGMVGRKLSALPMQDLKVNLQEKLKGPIRKLELGALLWGFLTGLLQAGILACCLAL